MAISAESRNRLMRIVKREAKYNMLVKTMSKTNNVTLITFSNASRCFESTSLLLCSTITEPIISEPDQIGLAAITIVVSSSNDLRRSVTNLPVNEFSSNWSEREPVVLP